MQKLDQLHRFVQFVQRRNSINRLIWMVGKFWVPALFVGLLISGIFFPALIPPTAVIIALLIVLAGCVSAVVTMHSKPSPLRKAKQIDDDLGWNDQLASALSFSEKSSSSSFMQASIDRALERVDGLDREAQFPLIFTPEIRVWGGVCLLLMFGYGLRFLSTVDWVNETSVNELAASDSEMESAFPEGIGGENSETPLSATSDIQDLLEQLREAAQQGDLEDWREVMDELGRESAGEVSVNDALLPEDLESVPWTGELSELNNLLKAPFLGEADKDGPEGIGKLEETPEPGEETSLETRGERFELDGIRNAESSSRRLSQRIRNAPTVIYRQITSSAPEGETRLNFARGTWTAEESLESVDFVKQYFQKVRPRP